MCLSVEFDIVAGAAISVVAIDAIRHHRTGRELPLALVPAVLAVHTFLSAVVWLGVDGTVSEPVAHSESNLKAVTDITEQTGTDFLIATGRLSHDETVPAAPRGRIPKDLTPKQRMARKLRTKPGRAAYARRKVIVEPVFGQIATLQGKHVLLRGLDNARGEWKLLAACHNLRKLNGHIGTAGLGSLRPAT